MRQPWRQPCRNRPVHRIHGHRLMVVKINLDETGKHVRASNQSTTFSHEFRDYREVAKVVEKYGLEPGQTIYVNARLESEDTDDAEEFIQLENRVGGRHNW